MAIKYMHTLEGKPAMYFKGEQICFATRGYDIKLCNSLSDIRKEQRKSKAWRKSLGLSEDTLKMSHVRVKF